MCFANDFKAKTMTFPICSRLLIFVFAGLTLLSCSNQQTNKMTKAEADSIANDIKDIYSRLTEYSEKAQLDSFLHCYDNSSLFVHVSSDGSMRNYEEFKNICSEYYTTLLQQKISTITEKINVVDTDLAVFAWKGNIIAGFKNGDTMKLNNYSISSVFKKIDGQWKIIHSHESGVPPEIIKKDNQ